MKKKLQIYFNNLKKSKFEVQINQPLRGDIITRSKGLPNKNINAIQLEMSKDLYMYDMERNTILKKQKL